MEHFITALVTFILTFWLAVYGITGGTIKVQGIECEVKQPTQGE